MNEDTKMSKTILLANNIDNCNTNTRDKKEFTFLIDSFLKHCLKSAEVDFNENNYDSLMQEWEKW